MLMPVVPDFNYVVSFVFFSLGLKLAKMMQCFHFMVEPAKNLTAKIKVSYFNMLWSVCFVCNIL